MAGVRLAGARLGHTGRLQQLGPARVPAVQRGLVDLGMELDAPCEAAGAEALRAAAFRACVDLDRAGRRLDAVLVPVQRVRAARDLREHRVVGDHGDRRPGDEAARQSRDLAAQCVRQQLRAEADAEERDLALHRLADQLDLGLELRLPRRLLAAEGDDAVDLVEGRQRVEVLLDRAERVRRVAQERLLQMVDDGDARRVQLP
jgi:hypothetical protein